jgi:hypothetical protein
VGVTKYPGAKRFLAKHGWTPAQIEAMPAMQAVLLQEVFEYDRHFDQLARGANLPHPLSQVVMRQANAEFQKAAGAPPFAAPVLAKLLLPAAGNVFSARARLDRDVAAFRVVEAVRVYADGNGDRLPTSLGEIKSVPVPDDPATGQPFVYAIKGDSAILTSRRRPWLPAKLPDETTRYEITLAR